MHTTPWRGPKACTPAPGRHSNPDGGDGHGDGDGNTVQTHKKNGKRKKSGGKTQDMNQPISTRVAEPRRTLGMDAAGKAAGRVKQQYPPM